MSRLWGDDQLRTLVLVNLAGIMEKADEVLLPGVYKEIGEDLHSSLAALGTLTLLRSITQALCFPLAAYFSQHYDRSNIIATGAFMWSVATFFVGISTTFTQIAVSRALNGIGLALVIPAIQSLVADSSDDSTRGAAFGWLQATANLGTIFGTFFSVYLAGTSFLGISGWRLSFFLVTIISVVVGALLLAFGVDPVVKTRTDERSLSKVWRGLAEAVAEGRMVLGVKTFRFIVAQGVVGSFPWAALAFTSLWLELKGFTHTQTAILLSFFTAAGSLGSLIGGFLGDHLSKHLPNSGRILLSQISSGSGVLISGLLLLGLSYKTSSVVSHGLVFILLGLLTSWNAPATNNPIFAEIVPEKARTSIYALDRSLESVLASFAPPIVGLLAEHLFGYVPPAPSKQTTINRNTGDALALGKALYTSYSIPMTICCLTYSFLYWTYPADRDRDRVRFKQAATAEPAGELGLSTEVLKYEKSENGYFLEPDVNGDEEAVAR